MEGLNNISKIIKLKNKKVRKDKVRRRSKFGKLVQKICCFKKDIESLALNYYKIEKK